MKQILLDTNFILTCVKQKIDFFKELFGNQIIIPEQVIEEIKRLKNPESEISLRLLEKSDFKKINIGSGHVDKKIIQYLKDKPEIILATLDRELQKKIKNRRLIIREKKRLEVI